MGAIRNMDVHNLSDIKCIWLEFFKPTSFCSDFIDGLIKDINFVQSKKFNSRSSKQRDKLNMRLYQNEHKW